MIVPIAASNIARKINSAGFVTPLWVYLYGLNANTFSHQDYGIFFTYLAGLLTLINPYVLLVLPIVLVGALNADRLGPAASADKTQPISLFQDKS